MTLARLLGSCSVSLRLLRRRPRAPTPSTTRSRNFSTTNSRTPSRRSRHLPASGAPTAPPILEALGDNRPLIDPAGTRLVYKYAAGDVINAKTGEKLAGVDAGALKKVRVNNGAAQRDRRGARLADPRQSPTRAKRVAARRRGFQIARREGSCRRSTRARQGDRPRAPRRLRQARAAILALRRRRRPSADRLAAIDVAESARRPGRAGPASTMSPQSRRSRPSKPRRSTRARGDQGAPRAVGRRCRTSCTALSLGFGAAARRDRPRHHLRRDGRHQHGAWRDGDARRLHDLCRAEPAAARRFSQWSLAHRAPARLPRRRRASASLIERLVIRFLYGRPLETLLATWGVSLILQQAVRTIFGANNRQVVAPAFMSGSFELGGLEITSGRLWIIVFAMRRVRRAAAGAARDLLRPAHARGHAEPPHGLVDGHLDRPHRHARLRRSVPASPESPASRCRRSTMSRPISARATSSTASWSSCSAASAISGARCSAR